MPSPLNRVRSSWGELKEHYELGSITEGKLSIRGDLSASADENKEPGWKTRERTSAGVNKGVRKVASAGV